MASAASVAISIETPSEVKTGSPPAAPASKMVTSKANVASPEIPEMGSMAVTVTVLTPSLRAILLSTTSTPPVKGYA